MAQVGPSKLVAAVALAAVALATPALAEPKQDAAMWVATTVAGTPAAEATARGLLIAYGNELQAAGAAGAAKVHTAVERYQQAIDDLRHRTHDQIQSEEATAAALAAIAADGPIPNAVLKPFEDAKRTVDLALVGPARAAEVGQRTLSTGLSRARSLAHDAAQFGVDFDQQMGRFASAPIASTVDQICTAKRELCDRPDFRPIVGLLQAGVNGGDVGGALRSALADRVPSTYRLIADPGAFTGDTRATVVASVSALREIATLTGNRDALRFADQVSSLTSSVTTYVDTFNALTSAFSAGSEIGSAVQVASLASGAGGVMAMAGALGALNGGGGGGPDPAVMGALAAIQQQVAQVRQEMNARFDAVDQRLNDVLNTLDLNFASIRQDLGNLLIDTDTIKSRLDAVDAKVTSLEGNVFQIAQDDDERRFQRVRQLCIIGTVESFDTFNGCLADLILETTLVSRNAAAQQASTSFPIDWLSRQSKQGPPGSEVIPNIQIWSRGSEALLELADKYPDFARQASVAARLREPLAAGKLAKDAIRNILAPNQTANQLLASAMTDYLAALESLRVQIDQMEARLSAEQAHGYAVWGAVLAQIPKKPMPAGLAVCARRPDRTPIDLSVVNPDIGKGGAIVGFPKIPIGDEFARFAPDIAFIAQDLVLGVVTPCYTADLECPQGWSDYSFWTRCRPRPGDKLLYGQVRFAVQWWFNDTFLGASGVLGGEVPTSFDRRLPKAGQLNWHAACYLGMVVDPCEEANFGTWHGGWTGEARSAAHNPGVRAAFLASAQPVASAVPGELDKLRTDTRNAFGRRRDIVVPEIMAALSGRPGASGDGVIAASAQLDTQRRRVASILAVFFSESLAARDDLQTFVDGASGLPSPGDLSGQLAGLLSAAQGNTPADAKRLGGLVKAMADSTGPLATSGVLGLKPLEQSLSARVTEIGQSVPANTELYPPLDTLLYRLDSLSSSS